MWLKVTSNHYFLLRPLDGPNGCFYLIHAYSDTMALESACHLHPCAFGIVYCSEIFVRLKQRKLCVWQYDREIPVASTPFYALLYPPATLEFLHLLLLLLNEKVRTTLAWHISSCIQYYVYSLRAPNQSHTTIDLFTLDRCTQNVARITAYYTVSHQTFPIYIYLSKQYYGRPFPL